MRTQIDHKKKLVTVWLTNAEQEDEGRQSELRSLYREYKGKKYTVAVFRSGQEDLAALTSHLLCHNRICAAKEELQREKQEIEQEGTWHIKERREAYQGPTMTFG